MTLSQEQINALLEGTGTFDAPAQEGLDAKEEAFFLDFSKVAMTAGSTAVSQALGNTVNFVAPETSVVQFASLQEELPAQQVLIQTGYHVSQLYESLLLIKEYDVAVIFDILMGKDGRNPDLEMSDLQISAIGEVMNQFMGASATALSEEYGAKLTMKAPESQQVDLEHASLFPAAFLNAPLLQVKYNLVIEGILDSEIYELRVLKSAQGLYQALTTPAAAPPPMAAPSPQQNQPPSAPPTMASPTPAPTSIPNYAPPPSMPPPPPSAPPPPVHPVEFSPLSSQSLVEATPHNFDRVVDIPLKVTVELGSKKIKIKDILDLNKGAVVELDRIAGEPVDMFVNGKLMAKGEVVVVHEKFGLRITEILGPNDRLKNLGSTPS